MEGRRRREKEEGEGGGGEEEGRRGRRGAGIVTLYGGIYQGLKVGNSIKGSKLFLLRVQL